MVSLGPWCADLIEKIVWLIVHLKALISLLIAQHILSKNAILVNI